MRQDKRRRDIKSKLIAAICMLLVSSIMMVSTTYAWFTLSTAPEVSGISTSVGANGNLEMALRKTGVPINQIVTGTSDSIYAAEANVLEANATWGNLVQLSDAAYGLNSIKLLPADLNAASNGEGGVKIVLDTNEAKSMHLKTPKYGADGRIASLSANTTAGTYQSGTGFLFGSDETYGVRGVGTTSAVTPRQSAYRNYRNQASAAVDAARGAARQVLEANGVAIANIAVGYGTGATGFAETDMTALQNMVTDLSAANGPIDQLELALKNYILAMVVSAKNAGTEDDPVTDTEALAAADALDDKTLAEILADSTVSSFLGEVSGWTELIGKFNGMEATLTATQQAIDTAKAAPANGSAADGKIYSWTQISGILSNLANPNGMKVNGWTVEQVKADKGGFINQLMADQMKVKVTVPTGSGFFADVADFAGNYQADVVMQEIDYQGNKMGPINATMYATTTKPATYMAVVSTAVETMGEPATTEQVGAALEDTYGYIIDLVFRTNAANANLQLQTQGVDRIYQDNGTANTDTLGHGSTMTFRAEGGLGQSEVAELIKCINIVFYDTDSGDIYGIAQLDGNAITTSDAGYVAPLYMMNYSFDDTNKLLRIGTMKTEAEEAYEAPVYEEDAVTYTVALAADATNAGAVTVESIAALEGAAYTLKLGNTVSGTNYTVTYSVAGVDGTKTVETVGSYATIPAADVTGNITITSVVDAGTGKGPVIDPTITALTQNVEKAVSVLVYLDGNRVTNAKVANGELSMSGTLNLQFSTNTELVPMDYSALQTQTETPETPEQGGEEG